MASEILKMWLYQQTTIVSVLVMILCEECRTTAKQKSFVYPMLADATYSRTSIIFYIDKNPKISIAYIGDGGIA